MQNNKSFWARSRADKKMIYVNSSDLKHDLACVFFTADVLSKYKARPSKYFITEGSITCDEEGWILQSCYVSTENEIYCYLTDLTVLPEAEQVYWQAHNIESPIGKENALGIERDFYCSFENSEKQDLQQSLTDLNAMRINIAKKEIQIWKPKENLNQMVNEVMRPHIEEYKQYRDDFLLPLSRLVVEGFLKSELEKWAKNLGIKLEVEWGSLIILEKCLAYICNAEKTKSIMKPLRELHKDKSSRTSHGGKEVEAQMIIKAEDILRKVTLSISDIVQVIKNYEA